VLPLGSILDRKYDLQEKIGEGAMGTVYRATHVVTQQELAVKVLSASRATETAKERFLREVRLAGSLRHPNVVQVVDAGEDEASETLYIVMEYLVGRNLEEVFESGELSRREGIEHLMQVLPALAEAHEAGIVHRDLKPENLFLGADDRVKLLDFGVARDLGGTKVTATGTAMGTPVYMSPEQGLRPKDVDHRSDLWSVGVILYELTASFPPFVDDSPHAVVFKANSEPHAPLTAVVPDTPPTLAALVDRCLAKDKEGRPADAHAIQAVLEQVLADERAAAFLAAPVAFGAGPSTAPVPLHSSPPPVGTGTGAGTATMEATIGRRPRAWMALVAVAAVALLGWLGWSLTRPDQEPPPAVATPAEPREPGPTTPPEPAPIPEPVPIQPVATEDEPSAERTPAPRLARRAPPRRSAGRRDEGRVPETAPTMEADPSPSVEPEPTMEAEPEPTMEAEPAPAPEPTPMDPAPPTDEAPAATPSERRSPSAMERPTRRRRTRRTPREPAAEPEPPPLTF